MSSTHFGETFSPPYVYDEHSFNNNNNNKDKHPDNNNYSNDQYRCCNTSHMFRTYSAPEPQQSTTPNLSECYNYSNGYDTSSLIAKPQPLLNQQMTSPEYLNSSHIVEENTNYLIESSKSILNNNNNIQHFGYNTDYNTNYNPYLIPPSSSSSNGFQPQTSFVETINNIPQQYSTAQIIDNNYNANYKNYYSHYDQSQFLPDSQTYSYHYPYSHYRSDNNGVCNNLQEKQELEYEYGSNINHNNYRHNTDTNYNNYHLLPTPVLQNKNEIQIKEDVPPSSLTSIKSVENLVSNKEHTFLYDTIYNQYQNEYNINNHDLDHMQHSSLPTAAQYNSHDLQIPLTPTFQDINQLETDIGNIIPEMASIPHVQDVLLPETMPDVNNLDPININGNHSSNQVLDYKKMLIEKILKLESENKKMIKQNETLHGLLENPTKSPSQQPENEGYFNTEISRPNLRKELKGISDELKKMEIKYEQYKNENINYEIEIMELQESISNIKQQLNNHHFNYSRFGEIDNENNDDDNENTNIDNNNYNYNYNNEQTSINKSGNINPNFQKKLNKSFIAPHILTAAQAKTQSYLSDEEVQANLIRTQIEYYFSDYNLKRDKRFWEKLRQGPILGYLDIKAVMLLSRIRSLCNNPKQLLNALKSSTCINCVFIENTTSSIIPFVNINNNNDNNNDEKNTNGTIYIGRKNFFSPTETEFPFRRSIFVYGLPLNADEKFVYDMLSTFGVVTKISFDHGPDTLDRMIMARLLEKDRVYQLFSKDSGNLPMYYNAINLNFVNTNEFQCRWCCKMRRFSEGYYYMPSNNNLYCVCLQCAGNQAEKQLHEYELQCAANNEIKENSQLKTMFLGTPPPLLTNNDNNNNNNNICYHSKTAICVFASQRQASKCVYVRSRLGHEGVFATHYHHYLKIKKDVVLSIKPKIKYMTSLKSSLLLSTNNDPIKTNSRLYDNNTKQNRLNIEYNREEEINNDYNQLQTDILNTIEEGEEHSLSRQFLTLDNVIDIDGVSNIESSFERLYTAPVYSYDGVPIVQMHQINT